VLDAMINN